MTTMISQNYTTESMDTLLPRYYKEYGLYVNNFRSFPLDLDGLKPVERRVLVVAHSIAKARFVKCAKIDGTCTAMYHPHGTAYGTLVQLARQGFLDQQGNFGNDYGTKPSPPAAMRYTEAKLNSEIDEMCFKLIDYVPWIDGEIEDKEPQFIPTRYPMCLLGKEYTEGIGFGYNTFIPCYSKQDLLKRLLWLLGVEKDKPTIKPITDCKILSGDDELEELLTTGRARIQVQGSLITDNVKYKAVIKSKPPKKTFDKILKAISKEMESGDIGYMDSSNKKYGTSIVFTVLKQRNVDKIFANCVGKLKEVLTGNMFFNTVVSDLKGTISVVSIDELLRRSYAMYCEVNKAMLESQITKIKVDILELKYLEKIKPELAKRMKTIHYDFNQAVKEISENTKIQEDIVRDILSKYRIRKLFTVTTDTKELEVMKTELESNLKNIKDFVLKQYMEDNINAV